MRPLQLILNFVAIAIASGAVYADHKREVATVLYRAAADVTISPNCNADCDVIVTVTPCSPGVVCQCERPVAVSAGGPPVTKIYRISKRVDNGPCEVVFRP